MSRTPYHPRSRTHCCRPHISVLVLQMWSWSYINARWLRRRLMAQDQFPVCFAATPCRCDNGCCRLLAVTISSSRSSWCRYCLARSGGCIVVMSSGLSPGCRSRRLWPPDWSGRYGLPYTASRTTRGRSRAVRGFILCDPIQPNPLAYWPNPTQCNGSYAFVVTYFIRRTSSYF